MKVAYIAGPYRAKTEYQLVQNIRKAEQAAIKLWKMGYAVITPHKNTSHLGGTCHDSVFLNGDLEILSRCDLVVLLEGWEHSEGARDEATHAELISIPVFYWPDDETKLIDLAKT